MVFINDIKLIPKIILLKKEVVTDVFYYQQFAFKATNDPVFESIRIIHVFNIDNIYLTCC